jgi:hypothetical protein
MVAPGSVYSRYLEGSFPAGGELQSPSWFGTCRRARSRPWVPICILHGSPRLWLWPLLHVPVGKCRQPGPVGNPGGFPEEGMLQLRRPGSMGSLWGPSSCLHRSRSLQRRHPSGPPRATDTRGPIQPQPPCRRPPFLCQVGDEVGSRLWKTARAAH